MRHYCFQKSKAINTIVGVFVSRVTPRIYVEYDVAVPGDDGHYRCSMAAVDLPIWCVLAKVESKIVGC